MTDSISGGARVTAPDAGQIVGPPDGVRDRFLLDAAEYGAHVDLDATMPIVERHGLSS